MKLLSSAQIVKDLAILKQHFFPFIPTKIELHIFGILEYSGSPNVFSTPVAPETCSNRQLLVPNLFLLHEEFWRGAPLSMF